MIRGNEGLHGRPLVRRPRWLERWTAADAFQFLIDVPDKFRRRFLDAVDRAEINRGRSGQHIGFGFTAGWNVHKHKAAIDQDDWRSLASVRIGGVKIAATLGAPDAGHAVGHFDFITGSLR